MQNFETKGGLLVGFYHHPANARLILKLLRQNRKLRSAAVINHDGMLKVINLRMGWVASLIFAIGIAFVVTFPAILRLYAHGINASDLARSAPFFFSVAAICFMVTRYPWIGVNNRLVISLKRWALHNETLIIIEGLM